MKSNFFSSPFGAIAPYYDKLMSFVNYPSWIAHIEKILLLSNIPDKIIFDLACGTGVCLELWSQKGYQVIGLDRSIDMLQVSKDRLLKSNNAILINGDMRNFRLARPMPVITCLYDSLNYMLTEAELLDCFRCVYNALGDKGVFIFDMNTVHSLRDEWGNNTFQRQDEGLLSVWSNTFNPNNNMSSLSITLQVRRNGQEMVLREHHQERGYSLPVITGLLQEAGFNASLYRHLTFIPAAEHDLRIMGVARK